MAMNIIRPVAAVLASIGAVVVLAAPANADPADDLCGHTVSLICGFLPIAPALEHDVDLTQESATLNGVQLPRSPAQSGLQDEGVRPSGCASGCI